MDKYSTGSYQAGYSQLSVDEKTGEVYSQDSSSITVHTLDYVTYGPNIPDWKERLKAGKDCTTLQIAQSERFTQQRGSLALKTIFNASFPEANQIRRIHTLSRGCFCSPVVYSESLDYDEIENEARMNFFKHARKAQRSMQGGVLAGEIGKVVNGIRHPVMSLRSALQHYLSRIKKSTKGKRRSRPDLLRTAADTWLETQYAVLPLAADIDGAMQALGELAYKRDSKRVMGWKAREMHSLSDENTYAVGGGFVLRTKISTRETLDVRFVGSVQCKGSDGAKSAQLKQSLGLGLSDFLPTAWELMPYSFLVDYFSNCGALIEAMSFLSSDINWVRLAWKKNVLSTVLPKLTVPEDSLNEKYIVMSSDLGSCEAELTQTQRSSVTVAYLMPTLAFKVPGLDEWRKWLNMAALGVSHSSLIPIGRI